MLKPTWATLPALAIRKAASADLPAVMAIECEQFSNHWNLEHFQAELANSFSSFYVAEDTQNQALAGFLVFWRLDSEVELHQLAVAGAYLRRGCGSALLDFFIRSARSWHCRRALLEVRAGNAAAIRLYEKFAFRTIGRRRDYYSLPTEDALVFELTL
ncbi:MAG TPA: ribosomal protein S18-alanine N-acetyltransferase [Candidatus Binatia bacterium]|nr:ribosomal protein S18-alanine N-acetyltransferase [Candidatus Binatia bacterium]